jgi:hypothetical protein
VREQREYQQGRRDAHWAAATGVIIGVITISFLIGVLLCGSIS